jgi:GAF domain-containing protein
LEALRRYHLLDTAPEESLDDVTHLAAYICGTPTALISLVDETRQWFKSRFGLELTETPREQAFCAHTILQPDLLEVEDARADARFADNPLVQSDPKIRFYAGAPLRTAEGLALGSLCVIDLAPRKLSNDQRDALNRLARLVMKAFEVRRVADALASASASVKVLSGMLPICAGCKQIRNDRGYWQQVENYVEQHSEASFSHSLCPECAKKYFPGLAK